MGRQKTTYEELIGKRVFRSYAEEAEYINDLILNGKITPIRASGTNGKKPAMYRRYWVITEDEDYSELMEEIKYRLSPEISIDYYRKHPEVYARERDLVKKLDDYLRNKAGILSVRISENERSYAIWGMEKFLSGNPVVRNGYKISAADILKHCGVSIEKLNIYRTNEPFAYYSINKTTPQNILILENLDPFYGMRAHLMAGNSSILGVPVSTLIYGGGKRVLSYFENFDLFAEDHIKSEDNVFYYFGDLDYEGIGIYEGLAERMRGIIEIRPFAEAYIELLKDIREEELPLSKEKQNRNAGDVFFSRFDAGYADIMKHLLDKGRYIPQEKLNILSY